MQDYPNGRLDREQFSRRLEQFFPSGDPSRFAQYFFDICDLDQDGAINFKEFICPLSLISRGDPDQKLKCAYLLFPPILRVVPFEGAPSGGANASSLIMTYIAPHDLPGVFQVYDIDGDGVISYAEMIAVVQSVYDLLGQMVELAEDEDTPEKVRSDKVSFHAEICADKKDLGGDWLFSELTRYSR